MFPELSARVGGWVFLLGAPIGLLFWLVISGADERRECRVGRLYHLLAVGISFLGVLTQLVEVWTGVVLGYKG